MILPMLFNDRSQSSSWQPSPDGQDVSTEVQDLEKPRKGNPPYEDQEIRRNKADKKDAPPEFKREHVEKGHDYQCDEHGGSEEHVDQVEDRILSLQIVEVKNIKGNDVAEGDQKDKIDALIQIDMKD
jgi:hypothetical protein